MRYKEFVKMIRVDIGATICNVDEDTRTLFKESAELSELNRKAKDTVIKEINKKRCDEMFEKIFGHSDLT